MRKTFSFLFVFVAIVALMQGCSSSKIVSNKDVGYEKQPKKIFIYIVNTKSTKLLWKELSQKLTDEFTRRNIQSDSYVHNPLSLETDEDINKKISDYAPEAVLTIKQTVTSSDWRIGDYELSLFDEETKKPVWKSQLNINAVSAPNMDIAVMQILKVIINKLSKDKII